MTTPEGYTVFEDEPLLSKPNGNDARAYFADLHGVELYRAQERLLSALLRRPSLFVWIARSGIGRHHFPEELLPAFDTAQNEPGQIKEIVAAHPESKVARFYKMGVELADGVALMLARQIVHSVARAEGNGAGNGKVPPVYISAGDDNAISPVDETKVDAGTVPPKDASASGASNEQAANGHNESNHGDAGDDLGSKGARTGQKPGDDNTEEENPDADLIDMNAKYAVVRIGGKTRVVSFEEAPTYAGCKVPVFSTIHDFRAFHAKRKKIVKGKKIGIGQWWIGHEQRRQFDGIVYAPGANEKTKCGKLNLWSGFGCEPCSGNCDLYLAHLHENICNGNKEHAEYLLDWMANAVQRPGRQGEVAVVMRGKEGTGKGMLANTFGRLFGSHFRHIVHAKHLTGHFNAHLQQCSVLHADEAFFAGDRAHESILKGLITEEMLLIEPKGVDPYQVLNCIHLIMSSNSDWVVPAGADARRYFVLNVSDAHMQDHKYFAAITKQMDSSGREALLHFLLNRNLSNFDVRLVPQTKALAEQKAHSRRGIDRLVEIVAKSGILPSVHPIYADVAVTTGEEKGDGFYCNARALAPDLKHDSSIIISATLKQHWKCEPWKSGNQRGIKFPPLAELRKLFDDRHGRQDWPAGDADWENS